ncbi:MAG TPA: hypothetical protein VKU01_36885 [Bryobacteraceae bacterium]|nr:hypothetical protein [Bryobacteraceae bacterium]
MSAPAAKVDRRHDIRKRTYQFFFLAFAVVLYATHVQFLKLPYFWDELGQFVPSALDILKSGSWVPHSATPNVHPPGVMAYLAGVWRVFGYSIVTTRVAMLVLASFGVLFTFLVGTRLCEGLPGIPALTAVLLLLLDPLFFTQSMMAQLDMPSMVFCLLGLLLFLEERHLGAAIACTAAVLSKETSVVLPLVLTLTLFREGELKRAGLYYTIPFAALIVWLIALWGATGNPLGDSGFAHYNVTYSLHPVRIAVSLVRRIYYIGFEDFRWVGTIAIVLAWRRFHLYNRPAWKVTVNFAVAFAVLVSVLGGAELERYLLPVMPIFYIAVAAALSKMNRFARLTAVLALAGGLFSGLFTNPPFPFPYENNLAMRDFVELHEAAAQYLEKNYPKSTIYTAWPLTAALRRPEFGYVQQPLKTLETSDLHYSTLSKLDPKTVDVLVLYSRTWEPQWGVMRLPGIESFLRSFYDYEPQMTAEQCREKLGLVQVSRWEQRGQWIEIYARPSA